MKSVLGPVSLKKAAFVAAAGAVLAAAAAIPTNVRSNQFALREMMGNVTSDEPMKPGFYTQIPLLEFTHVYDGNTQKISFDAGSGRWFPGSMFDSNTQDQNRLTAEVTLSYKVQPDEQKLILNRWAMRKWFDEPNGYFLITKFLNDSTNAVLGRQGMAQALADPDKFAKDLYQDLQVRFDLNNVPVQIQNLEVKKMHSNMWRPIHSVHNSIINATGAPVLPQPVAPSGSVPQTAPQVPKEP